jgi:hypothetical protein
MAYLLCVGSSLLCIIYWILNWNRSREAERAEALRGAHEDWYVEEEF